MFSNLDFKLSIFSVLPEWQVLFCHLGDSNIGEKPFSYKTFFEIISVMFGYLIWLARYVRTFLLSLTNPVQKIHFKKFLCFKKILLEW